MRTGCVEILSETLHAPLAFLSEDEFKAQVAQHAQGARTVRPNFRMFRNTELIYCNRLAACVESMGCEGILAEGADHVLGWRSPNYVYQPVNCHKIKLPLRNYALR